MKTSRRGFGALAIGAAVGALSSASVFERRAFAQTRANHAEGVYDNGIIQLNQNESARGPGPKTLEAIHDHTSRRVGRGYAPDHVGELEQSLADHYGIARQNVALATGSTPLLEGAVRAFCDAEKALVTPMPSYSTSLAAARRIGARTVELPLNRNLGIDLDQLADNARGAGMLYLCNPNNPTGTVHGPEAVAAFVNRVRGENPEVFIHIDEAYIYYAQPGAMATALPLAMENEKVFITRSFSKAHGLAGLRIGYAMGQPQTLRRIREAWGLGDVNMLGAIAALTAHEDQEHMAWEARENDEIRAEVSGFFRSLGYEVADSHTNHIFVNLRMPAAQFRSACLERNVLVGRDFPPLEQSHCRISLGSREEMAVAMDVFKRVLA